ncbi:two-component sensor histidine kinase [Thiocystis violacea]|nr:ATP-binding protein [Thiocystis violacea]MBK1717738.1 two-component sensor histidine kinase [Thiocystis violacea]
MSAGDGFAPPTPPDLQGRPPPRPSDDDTIYPTWGALRWLFLFRLLLVVGLVLAFSPTAVDPALAHSDTQLAWNILVVYALMVLMSGLGLSLRRPRRARQVQIAIFVDILTFTLLMHTAGGVTSGLGILLALSVAAGALMMEGRLSLLFAALASLAVIAEQIYGTLIGHGQSVSFTQAGLLGLLFFAVALLSHVLYRRVRSAEALAARRKVDIDDLSKLNDFIIHSISTGILAADGERRLRLVNQAALDLLQAKRVGSGASLSELSPELGRWLSGQVQSAFPRDGLIPIGEREVWASIKLLGHYRSSGVVIYLRDSQEAAREAQQIKLASLGTLTASIAHNIRNPLSAIGHAGQLLSEGPSLSEEDRHLLAIIERNCARIEETVHSVLQISRRDQIEPCLIELVAWTEAFVAEFREGQGVSQQQLRLQVADAAEPIAVEVDPRHLHQILVNLCDNALIHGTRAGEEARVQLRLGRVPDRGEVQLEIRDQGPGIEAATARDIFNPFFTTRSQGTGLGLYIARELAESNGIRLVHEQLKTRGSCFRLVFQSG